MKTTNAFLLRGLLFTAGFHFSAYAQGTFQNLDFEGAQIVPISGSPSWIATTNALPGWTGFVGANQVSRITYNNPLASHKGQYSGLILRFSEGTE